jgi:hypothetical protein
MRRNKSKEKEEEYENDFEELNENIGNNNSSRQKGKNSDGFGKNSSKRSVVKFISFFIIIITREMK